jgi:diguanylate cyclase (GGDEF)-like protein/PAS domain S-box-containing protein
VIIIADFDGRRSYVSASVQKQSGWTREELMGLKNFKMVHPEDSPKFEAIVSNLRNGADEALTECRIRMKNGEYLWVEFSLRSIRDPKSGLPTGILNIVRDISERKSIEQAREFQYSLIRAIHEVSRQGILVVNGESVVVSYNKRFVEVWKIPTHSLPAGQFGEVFSFPDQQLLYQTTQLTKDPEAFLERVQELYANPEVSDNCQVELKDGRTLERYSTSLRSKGGQYLGRVWFFEDITERKRTEQKREFQYSLIRAIQEESRLGILVVNGEGATVSVNRRFGDMWKLPALNLSIDSSGVMSSYLNHKMLYQCAPLVKDPEAYVKSILDLHAKPKVSEQSQVEMKDGRTLASYSTSLRSKDGQYLGRVWSFDDITERKLAEKKLQDAYHTVEALAITDALTGLANRRRFDQYLASEWRRGMREQQPLSLLMIDADHFKLYNDTYGHTLGDTCLKEIGNVALEVVVRPGDLVARFGGEEFVVLMPNTDSEGAMQVADEICKTMRERQIPHKLNPFGIMTVSVGCATITPQFPKTAAHLIELSDLALYEAKHNGRNQVCNGNLVEDRRKAHGPDEAI